MVSRKYLPWNPQKRVSMKTAKEQRLKKVLELVKAAKTEDEIGFALNPQNPLTRDSVRLYKLELVKRHLLERDGSGRIIIAQQAIKSAKWEAMLKEPFMQIPEIKKTWETMKAKNKGKGLGGMTGIINGILVTCNTLSVAPKDLLSGSYAFEKELEMNPNAEPDHLVSLSHAMLDFRKHMDNGTVKSLVKTSVGNYSFAEEEKSILFYSKCMRALYAANGKPVPRGYGGQGHVLSGAKENYGAYNHIALTDKQKPRGIKFMMDHYGIEYARFFAFMFEMMPRTKSLYNWMPSFIFEKKEIDGVICEYAKTRIFESKTNSTWPKSIYDPQIIAMAKETQQGKPLVTEKYRDFEKRFAKAMREFYVEEKILPATVLLSRKHSDFPTFKKTTTEIYFTDHSIYVLRHSGAHMWMRRSNYSASLVAKKGWDTTDILTDAYAEMPDDYELVAGTCYYCDPPQNRDTDNFVFCSPRHALVYLQNGQKPRSLPNLIPAQIEAQVQQTTDEKHLIDNQAKWENPSDEPNAELIRTPVPQVTTASGGQNN